MRKKFKLGSLKPGVVKTAKKIIDQAKAKQQDKARVKKMGGGMMGRKELNKGGGADYMNTVKAKKRGNPAVVTTTRKKRMGGGMMSRRMGYSAGSSKGKIPTTPKEKSLAKLAPPRNRITFGDVVAGRTKGKRMQAKHGTEDPLRDRMKQPLKKPKPTGTRSGGTRPRTGTKLDPNNPIIIKKKEFKKQFRKDAK